MKRFIYIAVTVILWAASASAAAPCVYAAAESSSEAEARKKDKEQEPIIDFTHRYMDVHLSMKLSKLKTLNKLLPNSLRREVGDEYYPEIRRRLTTGDSMSFKEGKASIERFPGGKVKLTLVFPNFIMVIREATWEQIDEVFEEYF